MPMPKKIDATDFIAVHLSPVWGDKANFKIFADISADDHKSEWEQLWVRNTANHTYEICCIPFFTYGLSLGDIVSIDDRLILTSTVKKSDHRTLRIWFAETPELTASDLGAKIFELGFPIEWQSTKMLAISALRQEKLNQLIEFLDSETLSNPIQYELG
jgi:hypothetical protein